MLFHLTLLNPGNVRFQSPENFLSFVIGYLGVDHGVLYVGVSEMVPDELYSLAGVQQMGGYGVSQGMDGVFGVNACFLRVSLEKLMRSLPAEIALSAGEQRVAGIRSLFKVLSEKLFRYPEERPFSSDPAFRSVDEYPLVFKVDVGGSERESLGYSESIEIGESE